MPVQVRVSTCECVRCLHKCPVLRAHALFYLYIACILCANACCRLHTCVCICNSTYTCMLVSVYVNTSQVHACICSYLSVFGYCKCILLSVLSSHVRVSICRCVLLCLYTYVFLRICVPFGRQSLALLRMRILSVHVRGSTCERAVSTCMCVIFCTHACFYVSVCVFLRVCA